MCLVNEGFTTWPVFFFVVALSECFECEFSSRVSKAGSPKLESSTRLYLLYGYLMVPSKLILKFLHSLAESSLALPFISLQVLACLRSC